MRKSNVRILNSGKTMGVNPGWRAGATGIPEYVCEEKTVRSGSTRRQRAILEIAGCQASAYAPREDFTVS